MDCPGHSLRCSNIIAGDLQNKATISPYIKDNKVEEQDVGINYAQCQGLQESAISSVCFSEIVNDQGSFENSGNNFSEDQNSRSMVPRISFPDIQISLSRPSSLSGKIITTELPSSDSLPIHQGQVGSKSANKLPFLTRIHSGHFHICLGLCSQTVLWKTLEDNTSSVVHFPFNLPAHFTTGLWCVALLSFLLISGAYLLKCLFHFDTVRMEYFDRIRVNYFFVPWIAAVLLRLGLPSSMGPDKVHPLLFCIFIVPFSVLELKIYGQWFTKGKRSLSRVANPSTYLAIIGNFVIARLAAKVEWKETAMFFLTVGLVHYVVVFVTLYQRLPSDADVSRTISPVFFLFIAAPSSASVAWEAVSGSFDSFGRMLFFLSLFLYLALVVRVDFFRDTIRSFSVISWAFVYPMTTSSVAAVKYAEEVKHPIAQTLAYILTSVSIVVLLVLVILTVSSFVVARDHLFPNDTLLVTYSEHKRTSLRAKRSRHSCFS